MHLLNFEQARQYAKNRLERELASNLLYHQISHTREEVVPAAKILAGMESLQAESLHLLLTAAWFHDIGYIEQVDQHEQIGARIAAQVLPSFGYTKEQVEIVRRAILATKLPQSPKGKLEEILADADLDVLGRENFMRRNEDLRRELAFLGKKFTDQEWYAGQLKFMKGHTYFTASARSLRDAQKILNINELGEALELLTSES